MPSSRFPGERKVIVCDCTVVGPVELDSGSLEIVRAKLRGVNDRRYGIGSSGFTALEG